MASCIVNVGLNSFDVSGLLHRIGNRPPKLISFVTGQPLGYYSSWALFALSHHYVVWMAASNVYPQATKPFTRYALLGDDIVIADKKVATESRSLLDRMGVAISDAKSLVSDNGSLEFAKRFLVKGLSVDLSPVSARAVLTVRSTLGLSQLAHKYSLSTNTLFRLAGAGFQVRARMLSSKSRGRRWERLWVAASKPPGKCQLPLEWWIGRGRPLNPYLKGILVDMLRRE